MGHIKRAIHTIDSDSPSQQIRTILNIGDTAYNPALQKVHQMMQSPNPDVRWACINTIAELKNPDSIPLLCNSLNDSNRWVRATAITALAKLKPYNVVSIVVGMLDDADSLVVIYALQALLAINQPLPSQAIVRIGQLLNDDRKVFEQYGETVSHAAQTVLNHLDNVTQPPVIEAIEAPPVQEYDLGDEEQWIREYISQTTPIEPIIDDEPSPDLEKATADSLVAWIESMVNQPMADPEPTIDVDPPMEENTHILAIEDINDNDEQLSDFDLDTIDDAADEAMSWLENLARSYGAAEQEKQSKQDSAAEKSADETT